ncbi:MAG: glycosyltransferase [Kouleothrix sp.]|jgi:glycosyltransferase involved in cell wall biosynthesis|nr:glycosyltransferase [Kouleothrix sp.]
MKTMQDQPLISIITAVKNGAPYLEHLILSVLSQGYPNFEHIIIDDGSDDEGKTVEILQKYPHLRWWSRENRGQYASQNEALAAAKGVLVGVISSDDVYMPNTLSVVAQYFGKHPGCDMIYGKTLRMNASGDLFPYQTDITGRYPAHLLRYYLFIQHCSLFVSRDLILRQQLWFDHNLRHVGDWDWIVRLAEQSKEIGYIPQPLSRIRIHSTQITRTTKTATILKEHYELCRRNKVNYNIYLLIRRILSIRAMILEFISIVRTEGSRSAAQRLKRYYKRQGYSS